MLRTFRIPWLHDRHTHVSLYGALQDCPDLSKATKPEALELLRALPGDDLSVVLGWHSGRLSFLPGELEDLPPAVLLNYSLHGFLLTGAARTRLSAVEPEMVERHGDSEWCERNLPRLLEFFSRRARLTPEKLDGFMARLEALGIGGAEDMLLADERSFQVIQRSCWAGRVRCWATPGTFRSLDPGSREGIAGLKLFTDGALGARTAALRGTYRDGSRGLLMHDLEALSGILAGLHSLGKPLAIHAIGDLAIEQILGVLEGLSRQGLFFPEVRLEHVQFIDDHQARRAKDLGLVLSMQPNFSSDSVDYSDRLEPRWLEVNNPFRMLIDRMGFVPGKDLLFGSDGMPHGVECALQWSLFPACPGQRLTLEELVAGYGTLPGSRGHTVVEIDEAAQRVKLQRSVPD